MRRARAARGSLLEGFAQNCARGGAKDFSDAGSDKGPLNAATKLHADILPDLAAALAGCLGIAPTGNIDPERRYASMFEPIHGRDTCRSPAPAYSIDGIFLEGYIVSMRWEVEYTDEFADWWNDLSEAEQESLDASVHLLEERGPNLGFPHSSGINGSRHGHMRELRTQHDGRPLRTLYAFDPRRAAILLIGGDKTGNARWYDTHVPIADRLDDEHLAQLRKEGLSDG